MCFYAELGRLDDAGTAHAAALEARPDFGPARLALAEVFPPEIKSTRYWRISLDDSPGLSYIPIPFPRLPSPSP